MEKTMNSAKECSKCDGCRYKNIKADGWCHMFYDKPLTLPCSQHDKFEVTRTTIGKILLKR